MKNTVNLQLQQQQHQKQPLLQQQSQRLEEQLSQATLALWATLYHRLQQKHLDLWMEL